MWAPLRCHSHYSLQTSAARAWQYAKRVTLQGYNAVGVTDLGSVSGTMELFTAVKDACKHCGNPRAMHDPAGKLLVKLERCPGYAPSGLTPVAGLELFVPRRDACDDAKDNDPLSRLGLIATSRAGWDRL